MLRYVINSAGSRIMSFEEDIFRSLFSVLPIIFLMNKSDISSDEDRAILRANLEKMALPNCIGFLNCYFPFLHTRIFETVSGHHFPMLNVTKCPSCGSDDLNIRKKQRVATCESCSKPVSAFVIQTFTHQDLFGSNFQRKANRQDSGNPTCISA